MSYEVEANKIPKNIKVKIKQASINVGGKLQPPKSDLNYLFEVYHKYITYYPPEIMIDCNNCRKRVRNFWRNITTKWTNI